MVVVTYILTVSKFFFWTLNGLLMFHPTEFSYIDQWLPFDTNHIIYWQRDMHNVHDWLAYLIDKFWN